MADKFKLIIMAEDGREVERLFDSFEDLKGFMADAIVKAGLKRDQIEHTLSTPEGPGMPAVDVYEQKPMRDPKP